MKTRQLVWIDEEGHKVKVKLSQEEADYAGSFIEGLLRLYDEVGFVNDVTVVVHGGAGPQAIHYVPSIYKRYEDYSEVE